MYASPCWSPRLRRDVTALESVQRHFTKRLMGLNNLSYTERLRHLHALPLEDMRTRANLRLAYKCLHHLCHVSLGDIGLSYQMRITRGAGVRLTVIYELTTVWLRIITYSDCVLYGMLCH